MNLLPFGKLAPHKPRAFLPLAINLGNWDEIKPLFAQLEERASHCKTAAALEQWLVDWSELNAALDEESSRRYIAMTCHTDNAEAEKAFLHFVENIDPHLKPYQFALEKIYIAHPLRDKLPGIVAAGILPAVEPGFQPGGKDVDVSNHPHSSEVSHIRSVVPGGRMPPSTAGKMPAATGRYAVFDRDVRNHVDLFREENVPLETEEAKLCQQYQKLSGALTVNFRGDEKTLVQMGRYLEEPDRALRQEAWELVAKRRLKEADNFEENFDELIKLRAQIAKNAGFDNYRDYAFRRLGRFDYTPADCLKFHHAVETEIMPAVREIHAKRQKDLGLGKLRPWDLSVDPQNRPPLKPFEEIDQMVSRTQKIFDRLDGELAGGFQEMHDLHLLDLDNRKGKAPGGYQSTLAESRKPFIFMNAIGIHRDVETILHEAGHAFHALATSEEDLYAYRSAPIEFCEVASMAMELLGNEFLNEFYAPTEANRARRTHLEGIIGFFPWMATVDAFQHWVYTHPGHTRAERARAWLDLMDRFGSDVDWTGFEDARAHLWHRQLHIFIHPFYYVEYGIAQLGALQVWANSKFDKVTALKDYKKGLALGGSRPLPELFSTAGCRFDFSDKTIQPLVRMMRDELSRL